MTLTATYALKATTQFSALPSTEAEPPKAKIIDSHFWILSTTGYMCWM